MNPEDLVLVGVINRKRDFIKARDEHWYRIPEGKAPRGIHADVLAFFLSGQVFKDKASTIAYFARRTGVELARRRDLLPEEADHKRADAVYHKIMLSPLEARIPPIVNKPNPHRFAFIYTTWDRFIAAEHIRDLYSTADYFVDRIFYALRQSGLKPQRTWDVTPSDLTYPSGARIRVLCENGEVVATTNPEDDHKEFIYLNPLDYLESDGTDVKNVAQRIKKEVKQRGGPRMVDLPVELY